MCKFAEGVGINLEGIRKDVYFCEGHYSSEAVYVVFEDEWPFTKNLMKQKLQR